MRLSAVALISLALAVTASAQIKVCEDKRLSDVKKLRQTAAVNTGSTGYITIAWDHPGPSPPALPACVAQYTVSVYPDGSTTPIRTQVLKVPPIAGGVYTASGLTAGKKYVFRVSAQNPKLGASGNGPVLATQPLLVPNPPPPTCDKKQPGMVKNIRLASAYNVGPTASTQTVAWDHPGDKRCVIEYVVDVYLAPRQSGAKPIRPTTTIKTTSPLAGGAIQVDNLTPGKSYQYWIYGRNPSLGASGNGIGLLSPAFVAPVGVSPLR